MKRFVPDDWELTDRLRLYAQKKGLSENQIADQEEAFRLCQFPRDILCFDRAWQRFIRNAIEWGKVVPASMPTYRQPKELSADEKAADEAKAWANLNKLRGIK